MDTIPKEDSALEYPLEFLNSIELAGLPPHILELKIGTLLLFLLLY